MGDTTNKCIGWVGDTCVDNLQWRSIVFENDQVTVRNAQDVESVGPRAGMEQLETFRKAQHLLQAISTGYGAWVEQHNNTPRTHFQYRPLCGPSESISSCCQYEIELDWWGHYSTLSTARGWHSSDDHQSPVTVEIMYGNYSHDSTFIVVIRNPTGGSDLILNVRKGALEHSWFKIPKARICDTPAVDNAGRRIFPPSSVCPNAVPSGK